MDWDLCLLRVQDLELKEVTDGFLVHQHDRDRVHYLNPTAAFVMEICDGTRRASELPDLVAEAFQLDAPPIEDVAACLAALLNEGLIVGAELPPGDRNQGLNLF